MNYEKIGKFIAELRKEQKMTQKDLANKLFITDSAISKWERGFGCPDISLIEDLSKALGVSVNEILAGERIDKMTKEKSDKIVKESIVNYTKMEKRKMIKRILIFIPIALVSLLVMYLTFNQIFQTRGVAWSTLSNIRHSRQFHRALQNFDYERINELLAPTSSINDTEFFGSPRTNYEYLERLRELEEIGVRFTNFRYSQAWFDGSNFAVEFQVTISYRDENSYLWVQTTERHGRITGIGWVFSFSEGEPERGLMDEYIWQKVLAIFTY